MARDGMRMKLNPDAKRQLRTYFEEAVKDADKEVRRVYQDILQYGRQKEYKGINGLLKDIKKQYMETSLYPIMVSEHKKWEEGDSSIHEVLRHMGAASEGDSLYKNACFFEQELKECHMKFYRIELEEPVESGEINLDKTIRGWIEELEVFYDQGIKALDTLLGERKKEIKNKAQEDNHLYSAIGTLIEAIYVADIEFLKKLKKGTGTEYRETLEKTGAKTVREEKEEAKKLKTFAESIGDVLKSESEVFKKILF